MGINMKHDHGRAYCRCGGAINVSAPVDVVRRALEIFWEGHQGEGHGACDAAKAAKVRAKKDAIASEIRKER